MARVLILGASGQVARAVERRLRGRHTLTVAGRAVLDLSNPEAAGAFVRASEADFVVNAAGYTAVDAAEDDAAAAFALNAEGPAAAAAAADEIGAIFIHFSTDYVFDGSRGSPYVEADTPRPLGVYGASKLAGERAVSEANPRHIILRTSWVCSPDGANFLTTMLRLARERESVGVVDDQQGCPTFSADLADVVSGIIDRLASGADGSPDPRPVGAAGIDPLAFGVFHAAGRGWTSWYGFASAIMAESAARGGAAYEVRPIATADYPTRVCRPVDSRLDGSKLEQVYGLRLPDWRDGLAGCLDTLYDNGATAGVLA